jgi:sensor histidine kinase regulating citrate/malate metabolism
MPALRLFRNLSIKRKLTLVAAMTSCVALVLAGGALSIYDMLSVKETLSQRLAIQAKIIGNNSTAALLFNDQQAAQEILMHDWDTSSIRSWKRQGFARIFSVAS